MRFYFLSDRPCALKLGGLYAGRVGGTEKFMDIDPSDNILCEFIPANGKYLPCSFEIDESFLPPEGIKEYLFPNAVALYAEDFIRRDSTLKLLLQENFSDCTVSVFVQGRVQVSIENERDIFTHVLSDSFESCRIERKENCIVLFGEGEIAVLNAAGELLLTKETISARLDEALEAVVPFADSMNHYAECKWKLTDRTELIEYKIACRLPPKENMLLYALTESLLIDADVKAFVTPSLYEKIRSLKKFLGDYLSVLFVTPEVVGLTYQIKENVFRVDYYTAEYKDGKIDNIKEKECESEGSLAERPI